MSEPVQHTLRVSLRGGRDNVTYRGTLLIRNWTSLLQDGLAAPAADGDATGDSDSELEDPTGASYYVIAVVLVYGFSIVMLIASHIKRKHQKLVEDRQINKYLQEFMVVHEKSSRDSYRHLKRTIIAKLYKDKSHTSKHLSKAIFPMMAIALPTPTPQDKAESSENLSHRRYSLDGSRRSVASVRLPAYRNLDEGVEGDSTGDERERGEAPSQDESGTSTPLHDRSMEPFEGVDPALSEFSFHEDSEVEGAGDEGTQDSCAASQTSTTESSSVFLQPDLPSSKPSMSHSHSDSIPLNNSLLALPPVDGPMPRKVSWSDDKSDSLITAIHEIGEPKEEGRRPRARPAAPAPAPAGGDVHNIHRPRSPVDTSPWSSRSSSEVSAAQPPAAGSGKTPTDGQFDLAAALLRHSMAYKAPQPPAPPAPAPHRPASSSNRPVSTPAAIKPPPPRHHPTVTIPRKPAAGSEGAAPRERGRAEGKAGEGVWLLNEQSRGLNGLMREEDPELYSLRHGHGMGSRSPLIKDRLSPVTPPSPHYGARLTPQPLLTPPPRTSARINPFFFTHRSSPQASPQDSPRRSPSPARRSPSPSAAAATTQSCRTSPTSPPPPGSGLQQRASSPGAREGEQESLLHITCV